MYRVLSWTEDSSSYETREPEPRCGMSRLLHASPSFREEINGFTVYESQRKVGTVLVSLSSRSITKNTFPEKYRKDIEGYFLKKIEEYKESIDSEEFEIFSYMVRDEEIINLVKA